LDHVVIDLSIDGVYTIDQPWTHFRSMFSFQEFQSSTPPPPFATLAVVVLNPLMPAVGAPTSINFEVYATMINIKTVETAPYNVQSFISIGETNVTNTTMSHMRDASLPTNITGDAMSATASVPFGLDAPADTRNQPSFLRACYQKVVSAISVLDVTRFALKSAPLVTFTKPIMDDLRVQHDEMDIAFYRNRWALENTCTITATQSAGTILCSGLLLPGNSYQATSTAPGPFVNPQVTFQSILASSFDYWRGSLKYRVVLSSNSFIRGKVLFVINYGNATGPPPSLTTGVVDPRSTHHIIVDISNTDKYIDIEVPFRGIDEIKRCSDMFQNPQSKTRADEFVVGTYALYLVSPVQVSAGVASSVNVSVLRAWGDDMNFYSYHSRKTIAAQSLLTPNSLASTRETRLMSLSCLTSLKELLLRPAFYGSYQMNTNAQTVGTTWGYNQPLAIPIHPMFLANNPDWSFVMSAYAGLTGSYRVLVRLTTGSGGWSSPYRVTYFPYISKANLSTATLVTPQTSMQLANGVTDYASTNPALLYPYPDQDLPQIIPALTFVRTATNSVGNAFYETATATESEIIVDAVNQPEAIVEIPEPAPLYRTQCTQQIPLIYTNVGTPYPLANPGRYNPFFDQSVPFIVLTPLPVQLVAPSLSDTNSNIVNVSVYLMAGDDLRFFWYQGGPTAATLGQNVFTLPSVTTIGQYYEAVQANA